VLPRQLHKVGPLLDVLVIGPFTLGEKGMSVKGRPSFEEYERVGVFIRNAHKASGWWLADWIAYGEGREEWKPKLEAMMGPDIVKDATVRQYRYIAKKFPPSTRVDGASFSHHAAVVNLSDDLAQEALEKAVHEDLSAHETQRAGRQMQRRKVLEGQAVLEGVYRVLYADPPWIYGNRPPSGFGAQEHYRGMTIEDLCKLPVQAHTSVNAVLFLWVTAPMLYENPGPREVIEAWGFTPKTGIVWDKVRHNFGNYVSVRHEHLLIATRGSCTPDRPTPMPDSVVTERPEGEHSAKPESFRKLIETLYDGPYLELFARRRSDGWTSWGDDPRAWPSDTENFAGVVAR